MFVIAIRGPVGSGCTARVVLSVIDDIGKDVMFDGERHLTNIPNMKMMKILPDNKI